MTARCERCGAPASGHVGIGGVTLETVCSRCRPIVLRESANAVIDGDPEIARVIEAAKRSLTDAERADARVARRAERRCFALVRVA